MLVTVDKIVNKETIWKERNKFSHFHHITPCCVLSDIAPALMAEDWTFWPCKQSENLEELYNVE